MPFLGSTWPLLLIWKPAHHFFRRSFTLLSADRSVKFEGLKGFREERGKKPDFHFRRKYAESAETSFGRQEIAVKFKRDSFFVFFFLERHIPRFPGSVFRWKEYNRCGPLFLENLFWNSVYKLGIATCWCDNSIEEVCKWLWRAKFTSFSWKCVDTAATTGRIK